MRVVNYFIIIIEQETLKINELVLQIQILGKENKPKKVKENLGEGNPRWQSWKKLSSPLLVYVPNLPLDTQQFLLRKN